MRNADGTRKVDDRGIQVYDQGTSTNAVRPGSAPRGNHAVNLLLDDNDAVTDHFSGSLYAVLTPIEGLTLTARLSPEVANVRSRYLQNPFYNEVTNQGAITIAHDRIFTVNQQYLASYKKTFMDDHMVEVLAGYENFNLMQQNLQGRNDHLYSPFIGELNNAFGAQPTSGNLGSYTERFATAGVFGRLQYDFRERYFFNATVRHEASSRFSPDNRWGTFGSVGAAWIISKESFFTELAGSWVEELKLKASYGTQGNDQLRNYYAYRDLYTISYNSTTGEYSKTLYQKGNPDLTWEAQKLFNVGLEFSLLDDRISGSAEYFSRMNSDMLFNVPMPPSAGYSTEPQNVGSVLNNGFELEVEGSIVRTNDVHWSVFANITTINNEIKSLPDYTKELGGLKSTSYILKEGGSLNQAYMVEYAGVDKATGKSLYYVDPDNGDRSTTTVFADAKQADLGDISVKAYGGFGTNVEAYGFDLSASFAYQLGGKSYDGGYQGLMHTGKQLGRNWHTDILDAWTPENPNANVPRISSADDHDQDVTNRWLISSNYLCLNNLIIGYTLPFKLTDKLQISKLRVYLSGDNLFLLSARKGFDPRQLQNAMASGVGFSTTSGNFVYSQLRVLSGGLSITF